MDTLNNMKSKLVAVWQFVVYPLRELALREGTAPNNDMVMTRVVKRILMVD